MAGGLKNSTSVWKLARDLGIAGSGEDSLAGIIKFCERRVKKVLETFPDCHTLSDLLDCMAGKLDTIFEIVTSDENLGQIQRKYVNNGEKIFAGLDKELSEDVFAITYRRNNRESWEPEFISVIDVRGAKASRAYFTKWHELAHLLTLTDQLRLSFRRTHIAKNFNSPEEALMEVIAGHFGFYSPIVKPTYPARYRSTQSKFYGKNSVRKRANNPP